MGLCLKHAKNVLICRRRGNKYNNFLKPSICSGFNHKLASFRHLKNKINLATHVNASWFMILLIFIIENKMSGSKKTSAGLHIVTLLMYFMLNYILCDI